MDTVHLLAAAAWLGALVPLGFILAQTQCSLAPIWIGLARKIIPRFSILGLVSVACLIVTGLVNAGFLVGDSTHLIATAYGRLLLLKLGLVGLMLVIAADNRFRLTPRLLATAGQDDAGSRSTASGQLWCNVIVEIGLGAAILFIVGALGIIHPAAHIRF
jgi:putative copper resistance protein D